MPPRRDVVVIGAGHNGLVAAFYLAKAGLKPLVLERRPMVGGVSVTEEFHPGFRVSTLAHTAGPIATSILRDMQLERHGLRWIEPEPRVVGLPREGRPVLLYGNVERSVAELTKSSLEDAKNYRPISITRTLLIFCSCCVPGAACASWARRTCTACCAGRPCR